MKILIISDVHGTSNWKNDIVKYENQYDHIIFMGDYFDNYKLAYKGMKALENFQDICKFARENKNVRLLIGNHDYDNYILFGNCSGFQKDYFSIYHNELLKNIDLLDIAVKFDDYVFSHGGFSKTWLDKLINFDFNFITKENWNKLSSIDKTNYIFHKQFEDDVKGIGEWFTFFECDMSNCGENQYQSPLWLRPSTLLEHSAFEKQVVGHTEYCIDEYVALKKDNNYVLLTDSAHHNSFGIFDTEKPIEAITMLDLEKLYKNKIGAINNLKSRLGCMNINDDEKLKIIAEEFGKDKLQYYRYYFEE